MRGYRPSQFADSLDSDPVDTEELAQDPERVRRIVIYVERVRNGLPLFEESIEVPVRHSPERFRRAKAG